MELVSLRDETLADLKCQWFGAAVFASGFETRAVSVSKRLDPRKLERVYVLGFEEHQDYGSRDKNDSFFRSRHPLEFMSARYGDEGRPGAFLNEFLTPTSTSYTVLVDYTSMSRAWYAAIINYLTYQTSDADVDICFTYAEGRYKGILPPKTISEIKAIPGCEGQPDPTRGTVAIFMLGYDPISALAVLEDLEPDEVVPVIAAAQNSPGALRRALKANEAFLKEVRREPIHVPLLSVERVYGELLQMSMAYLSTNNVVIVPIGPKTHTLAAILLANQFRLISCLYAVGLYRQPIIIEESRRFGVTKARFSQRKRQSV